MTGSKPTVLRVATAAVVGATAAVAYSPAVQRIFVRPASTCIFRRATGLRCPLCGLTHAVIALVHGDLAHALAQNPLVIPYVILLAVLLAMAYSVRANASIGAVAAHVSARGWSATAAGIVAFGIGRNL